MAPEGELNEDGPAGGGESGTAIPDDAQIAGSFAKLKGLIGHKPTGGVKPGVDQYGVSTRGDSDSGSGPAR